MNSKIISKTRKLEDRYRKIANKKQLSKTGNVNESDEVKLLNDASLLGTELESVIMSVSDNEFIKNKHQRLTKLGKSKESINLVLNKLTTDIKQSIVQSTIEKQNSNSNRNNNRNQFSMHKFFSARDVLSKINPELLSEVEQSLDTKVDEPSPSLLNKNNKVNERNDYIIEKAEENASKERIDVSVNLDDPVYEPIKLNVREDENSIHKISENNEKIYSTLMSMGEVQMANHLHTMMERVKIGPKYKYVSEINENTKQLKSVNDSNSNIEKSLNEIRLSLKTKQDTDIEREEAIEGVLVNEIVAEQSEEYITEENGGSFLEKMLGMMFGTGLLRLLMGAAGKGILFLAKGILVPAMGWLLRSLTSGISTLFNKLLSGPMAIFQALRDKVYKFIDVTFDKFKNGFNVLKNTVKNIPSLIDDKIKVVKDFLSNKITEVTKRISNIAKAVKGIISKIPGLSVFSKLLGEDKPKLSNSKQVPSKKGFLGRAVDSAVDSAKGAAGKVKDTVVAGGKAVYAAGGKAVDWSKGKLATVRKSISDVAAKVGSKFSPIPKKLTDHVARSGGIPAKTGVMAKLGKFAKVLRPIPFLGQALMVGFAAKAAENGWNNAGELYGVSQDDVSAPGKAASAVGALVKDLLWPIPINQSTVASVALSLTGSSVTKGGNPLKSNYKEGVMGDVSQFEGSPDDDFQPSGFSDEELLTFKPSTFKDSFSSFNPSDAFGSPAGDYSTKNTPKNLSGKSIMDTMFDGDTHPIRTPSDSGLMNSSLIGVVSAKYESGNKGVHTVSSGRGDPGGVSYGAYQLASKTGTMTTFLNSSNGSQYREQFSGTKPGTEAFNNIYAKIAAQDPQGFNEAQHLFIKRTHYDPVASIASSLGINTSNRAIQEALWSQSVQHGRKGNIKILNGAMKLANPDNNSDMLRAIYNSRSNYVRGLSINSDTKSSILNRYNNELNDVLSISGSISGSTGSDSETIVMEPEVPVKVVDTQSIMYDNSDIPVVPDYLANPKPFSVPESLNTTTKDLMRVESKTPLMMQGVQGAKAVKLTKPEDAMEHDPREDVESHEFTQPTKGDGVNLKVLQDKYISLYAPWNPDFDGLRPETKKRFLGMAKEFFETTGNKIQVNSAFRSIEKQQELWDNRDKNSNPVAKPGGSIHNFGMALDIQSDQVKALKSSGLLQKYGFGTPVKNDPPHIEDITVDRDSIRSQETNEVDKTNVTVSPSFGTPYDGESADYADSKTDVLSELGLDSAKILEAFKETYSQSTSKGTSKSTRNNKPVVDSINDPINDIVTKPINNKTKSQAEMDSIINSTEELVQSENTVIYDYIDKVTNQLTNQIQETINNNTVINNATKETSELFSINNNEYYPEDILRY